MEISDNARVYSARDEHLGKVDRIVIDPVTRKLSHIVVRSGILFPEDKVIPVADIATATAERINLVTGIKPDEYPAFEERHYVPLSVATDEAGIAQPRLPTLPLFAWHGQVGVLSPLHETFTSTVTARNIPESAVAIEPGASVIAEDDQMIGAVKEVLATEDGMATHIVMSDDELNSPERAVPITFVDRIVEGSVRLAVDRAVVASLPPHTERSREVSAASGGNDASTIQIGGYRLQIALSDVTDLTLQIQHLRWNLPDNDDELRAQLDDFDALVRAGADSIAQRMRELGVAPDGRINTVYQDLLFEPLSAGPFDAGTATRALSRRLAQMATRLRDSREVIEEPDPESHKVLQVFSEEILRWADGLSVGGQRVV